MSKTIKAFSTKNYSIELVEHNSGYYYINYQNHKNVGMLSSEMVVDFKMASYMFDLKHEELEGQ